MTDFLLSAWTVCYTVFLAIFLFGITIFVHEFGHFIAALKQGFDAEFVPVVYGGFVNQKNFIAGAQAGGIGGAVGFDGSDERANLRARIITGDQPDSQCKHNRQQDVSNRTGEGDGDFLPR